MTDSHSYPVSASEALAKRLDDADFVLIRNCPMVTKFDHENVDAILTGEEHNLIVTALRTGGVAQARRDREPFISVLASLAAAISLLERIPNAKKAAPSDKMFEQMLTDYRRALEAGRSALSSTPAQASPEPVAYTNKEQLGFLRDPQFALIPMAMWAKPSGLARIPLYSSALPSTQVPAQAAWQPIETTPKDKELLLGWYRTWPEPSWEVAAGLAGSTKGGWLHGQATHWMPLPGPPLPSTDKSGAA